MKNIRTDLAVEAKELWRESASEQTQLSGVEASDKDLHGFQVTTVKILDENGERELGKPKGTYVTIELDSLIRREDEAFERGTSAVNAELRAMLHLEPGQTVLIVGLGNADITPDAVGPITANHVMVTRHLVEKLPEQFGTMRPVTVLKTGVLGTTGIESSELIRAVAEKFRPDCIVAVDALASRKLSRVCRTIQLADTGIVPGSGVGNARAEISRATLGIPVVAVGVPTVVDATTLTTDLAEQAGVTDLRREDLDRFGGSMIVTPKEIDTQVRDISKLLGYGINLALHDGFQVDDINMFLS